MKGFRVTKIVKGIKSEVAWGNLEAKTIHRIFETNSSFDVNQRTTGKVQILSFKVFLLVITKFSFWQEDWALVYHSMKFWDFPDIS